MPNQLRRVVDVKWFGSNVVELTYKDASGCTGNELLYRDRELPEEIQFQFRSADEYVFSVTQDSIMLKKLRKR